MTACFSNLSPPPSSLRMVTGRKNRSLETYDSGDPGIGTLEGLRLRIMKCIRSRTPTSKRKRERKKPRTPMESRWSHRGDCCRHLCPTRN